MFRADDLDREADRLLATIERDRSEPHYTDHYFQRKIREGEKRDKRLGFCVPLREDQLLWRREWRVILRRADLTAAQREVVELRALGWTLESIGERRSCTKQGILNIWNQAVKKIRRALDVYPYRGLAEVYRAESRRGLATTRPR
ncbi:MAG TPA: hypothetical protein PLO61_03680 [Fimbriimonadaceae bacterium]|nr:hypothetical protein [Fimbriimonadaceae bacterium]HRJ32731.1 hypothetical protein [Fimbriimonadaceae bacterium]